MSDTVVRERMKLFVELLREVLDSEHSMEMDVVAETNGSVQVLVRDDSMEMDVVAETNGSVQILVRDDASPVNLATLTYVGTFEGSTMVRVDFEAEAPVVMSMVPKYVAAVLVT